MRENGVDSPSYPVDFCIRFGTYQTILHRECYRTLRYVSICVGMSVVSFSMNEKNRSLSNEKLKQTEPQKERLRIRREHIRKQKTQETTPGHPQKIEAW